MPRHAIMLLVPEHFHFGQITVAGVAVPTLAIPMPDGSNLTIAYSDARALGQCLIENEDRCRATAAALPDQLAH